jgi:hypothetical protein
VTTGCAVHDPFSSGAATPAPTTGLDAPTPSATTTSTVNPTGAAAGPVTTPTGDQKGDGDAAGNQGPATAGGGVCAHLAASAVARVVDAQVSGSALGGPPGCEFKTSNGTTADVTVTDMTVAAAHGMAGARNDATSGVEGTPTDVGGIGDAAFVVTGTMFGEPAIAGAGAVQIHGRILAVSYSQDGGRSAPEVKATMIDLLRLVAGAAA